MAYVSNVLTHWVGRCKHPDEQYAILTDCILKKKELLYGLSPWHFGSKYGGVDKSHPFMIPMISFTDIPLSECAKLCDRYSHFGLSFEKGYLANCLASPVGYVQHAVIHENYSLIYQNLHSMRELLKGVKIPEGVHKGKVYDMGDLLLRWQYMMFFLEDYSVNEFEYNKGHDIPLPDAERFFEDESALYYEREWRMVAFGHARFVPWHVVRDGKTYFTFDEQFLKWVIVPRAYLAKMKEETASIFSNYKLGHVPPVIAYEDLEYL